MNQLNAEGQRHGLWEEYFKNGQLWWRGNFVNGKAHGPYESYYHNGQLSSKGIFKDDQWIGFWLYGWSSGEILKQFYL